MWRLFALWLADGSGCYTIVMTVPAVSDGEIGPWCPDGFPSLVVVDEGDGVVTWYLRRSTDDLMRYACCHGSEGMLSPAQGLVDGRYPFPEHVGLSTVVDY